MTSSGTISVGDKLKDVGKHSIIYGLGGVAQSAAGFFLLPILTGSFSKTDFGVYSLILTVSAVASAVFYFGMTSALPRSYFDYSSDDDRRAVFTTAFVLLIAGAFIQILLGFAFGQKISLLLTRQSQYSVAVFWSLFSAAIGFVNGYFYSYLRQLRKSVASIVFSAIGFAGSVGLTLLLLRFSSVDIVVPFKAAAYTQLIISLSFGAIYGKSAFIPRLKKCEVKNLLSFGSASIVASFGAMLLEWPDRFIIEHYLGASL